MNIQYQKYYTLSFQFSKKITTNKQKCVFRFILNYLTFYINLFNNKCISHKNCLLSDKLEMII